MLSHSTDRFYVKPKYILLTIDDVKISPVTCDMGCSYLNVQLDTRIHAVKHIPTMKKIVLKWNAMYIFITRKLLKQKVHNILIKEIPLILQIFKKFKQLKEKW